MQFYDSENAEVSCTTSSSVKFMIVLFENEAKDANTTIVSIPKVKGCSMAFNIERQAATKAVPNDSVPLKKHQNATIANKNFKTLDVLSSTGDILNILDMASKDL